MSRTSGITDGKALQLSESSEMYLQVIWRLTEKEGDVSITDIARALGHSLSTVSERVTRLTAAGLLRHEWRERVSMTPKGRKMACRTIRKRRLLETFLFTMAGYGIHELHEDACRLEHLISDRFADALDRMLGYPVHDPHGHPIPSSDGTLRKESLEPLSAVAEGQTVRIAQLRSADPEVLEYAARLGLLPGKSCTVIQKAPFQGPLTIADGSERIAIAFELASVIDIQASTEESPDVSDSSRQSISSFVRQSAGH